MSVYELVKSHNDGTVVRRLPSMDRAAFVAHNGL